MPDHILPRNDANRNAFRNQETMRLSALSPEDSSWDEQGRRAQNTREWMLRGDEWQQKKAENMETCGKWLLFAIKNEGKHVLHDARFCRTRLCPRCQWRRANAWKARWQNSWPAIKASAPKARYISLVFSLPTIPATELKNRLDLMNLAWTRMTKRRRWPGIGFARSTEITIRPGGHVNPHFHCLVMVSSTYFSKNYMSAEVWAEWWADALRMDLESTFKGKKPYVSVADRPRKKDGNIIERVGADFDPEACVARSVLETFKYAVKGVGMIADEADDIDDEWIKTFLEVDRQLKGTRAQALGGLIKKAFKEDGDITEEEMIGSNEDPDEETLAFWLYMWNAQAKWYARSRVLEAEEVQFLEMKEEDKKRRKGAHSKPLPDELRASQAMKDDWDLNRIGLQLNMNDQAKKSKKRKTASRRPDKGLPS